MPTVPATDGNDIRHIPARPVSRSSCTPILALMVIGLASGSTHAQSAQGRMQVSTRVINNCLMQVNSAAAAVVTSYACPLTAAAPTITLSTVTVTSLDTPEKMGNTATSEVTPEKGHIRISTITRPNGLTGSHIQPTLLSSMEGQNALMTVTY